MERLDILEKIYLYGETLSSEEMNLIVSHINIIIDAVNSLIRNNSGISNGHCEMRYILNTSLPTKPATGTNGLSNGWSDLYLLPEVGTGKSTWMSLCFVSGENGYGEWSTPICLSSGTVTGLLGPKGDSGEVGAFVSRVFKRQNSKPDRPTGGSYSNPIPDGWYDGVPDGTAIIWSSTCTFYGNGTQTEWSEPAQESDTATLDIEFSPLLTQPPAPLGSTPFSNHESEGWYDPNSSNFISAGTMIWRAERKVANGEYDGDWTITRIYGEQGEKGLKGEDGGHYEFRYTNFKATQDLAAPIKPADGTDGTSGGWNRTQQSLTEIEIKEGLFTWMTQCYFDNGTYGTWSTPIRITGANGIDGEDGTELEFIYTRNNTGDIPATPPRTLKNEAALFNELGEWTVNGITWTDDPQGVNDEIMWEYVSTRVKEGTIWSEWSTPVVWAKWGKLGRIGQMSYLAGVWNAQTTYVKTAERNPVVYYDNDYYYLIGELTFEGPNKHITEITSTGLNPKTNTNVWAKAESYEMVFTDILFVLEFAKLASFIINEDWMISRNGTIYDANGGAHDIDRNHYWINGGNRYDANTAYVEFDPSYPDSSKSGSINFVPAIAIDSLSGRAFFWKGKFTGDIHANSGYFKGEVHATSGDFTGTVTAGGGSKIGKFTVDSNGNISGNNATFTGNIVANSLTLGSGVTVPYDKLSNKPTIPTAISDLTGSANILYASDVSISEQTISNGLTKRTITVGDKTFTEIEGGDFILTNVGLGTDSNNNNYVKISNNGVLKARNAIIYGTIYANAGNIGGFSIDSNGNISGSNATFSGIVNAIGGTFSGNITIGGTLTILKPGGSDGLKLDSDGSIKRWDGSDWVPLYAGRHVKLVITSSYTCTAADDFILVNYSEASVYLPASPSNGKTISVRNLMTNSFCKLYSTSQIIAGPYAELITQGNYYGIKLYGNDRAELVYYGNKWYWNYSET